MKMPQRVKSDLAYVRNMVEAGFEGATSVRKDGARLAASPRPNRARTEWVSAAIGVAVGMGSACLARERKSPYSVLLSGMVGGSLGYGGALAWGSRDRTVAMAGSAMQKVNAVRDARWLEKNPIAYA
jgi:hypothetical protein